MAFALLTHAAAASNGTTATTSAIDTTGATFLVAVLDGSVATLTDSANNTWVAAGGTSALKVWFCLNPVTSAAHTFSITANFTCVVVASFSGAVGAPIVGKKTTGSSSTGTTIACGSLTPPTNDELVIYALGGSFPGTASIDTGTITDQVSWTNSVTFGGALAYEIQTTATTRNATWTITSSSVSAIAVSFRAATHGVLRTLDSLSVTTFNVESGTATNFNTV